MSVIRISRLDANRRLIGASMADVGEDGEISRALDPGELEVDPGDLPLDGTYKWDEKRRAFVPLGHGFERVSERPPVSDAYVLYLTARALGDKAPQEVRDWCRWYERSLKQRDEERAVRFRIERGA